MMIDIIKDYLSRVDAVKTCVALTSLITLAFMCYALVYVPIPESNKEALYILIGIISSTVSMIGNFYFGSSKGSQKKTELIDKITETK